MISGINNTLQNIQKEANMDETILDKPNEVLEKSKSIMFIFLGRTTYFGPFSQKKTDLKTITHYALICNSFSTCLHIMQWPTTNLKMIMHIGETEPSRY